MSSHQGQAVLEAVNRSRRFGQFLAVDSVNNLSLHLLHRLGILDVKEIERDEIKFIRKSTGCKRIADIDSFAKHKVGSAALVEEVHSSASRIVKITGTRPAASHPVLCLGRTISTVVRGTNGLILDEAERSLHDHLYTIRRLAKKKAFTAGGSGAAEIEIVSRMYRACSATPASCRASPWRRRENHSRTDRANRRGKTDLLPPFICF